MIECKNNIIKIFDLDLSMKFLFQRLGNHAAYLVLIVWCTYDFVAYLGLWECEWGNGRG